MANTIFFSWQADTPLGENKYFLKEVLEDVCKEIFGDTTIDEALRDLEVDTDTKGVAGHPPIVETIFRKIDLSSVFFADMTFVGKRTDGRSTPNPNVLIEYGWALKGLGKERYVLIMNTAYGEPDGENLPFDLRHVRWPIRYHLPEGATKDKISEEKNKLKPVLRDAIRACLATIPPSISTKALEFPKAVPRDGPARFRASGESLGFKDDFAGDEPVEVFLKGGPAMWLRVFPTQLQEKKWTPHGLKEVALKDTSSVLPLGGNGWSFYRAEDGIGMYAGTNNVATPINTLSATMVFATGEIWSTDVSLMTYSADRLFFGDIERLLSGGIGKYTKFLISIGVKGPFRWEAGIVGARKRTLGYPPPPGKMWVHDSGPICAGDLIVAEGEYNENDDPLVTLGAFFENLFEKCGRDFPDYLRHK